MVWSQLGQEDVMVETEGRPDKRIYKATDSSSKVVLKAVPSLSPS